MFFFCKDEDEKKKINKFLQLLHLSFFRPYPVSSWIINLPFASISFFFLIAQRWFFFLPFVSRFPSMRFLYFFFACCTFLFCKTPAPEEQFQLFPNLRIYGHQLIMFEGMSEWMYTSCFANIYSKVHPGNKFVLWYSFHIFMNIFNVWY